MSPAQSSRHLSVMRAEAAVVPARMTRSQVAARLAVSVSTVRRFEGVRLHPEIDAHDVRTFAEVEVAALAAELANEPRVRRQRSASVGDTATNAGQSDGELAALVFERLEQRQSLAEIVIALRVEPPVVRALFDQWCLGLTEGQLRMQRQPNVAREGEIERGSVEGLAARLAEIPRAAVTRISVARHRGPFQHEDIEYAWAVDLGGFHVSGPCETAEISQRFGSGDYRVTAYGFDPPGLRWELFVDGLGA